MAHRLNKPKKPASAKRLADAVKTARSRNPSHFKGLNDVQIAEAARLANLIFSNNEDTSFLYSFFASISRFKTAHTNTVKAMARHSVFVMDPGIVKAYEDAHECAKSMSDAVNKLGDMGKVLACAEDIAIGIMTPIARALPLGAKPSGKAIRP